jgi:glycosyltransferase involved in cell wall biosynthesis
MNILLIIPELGQGGAERAISKLSTIFSNAENNLFILTFNKVIALEYDIEGTHLSLDVLPARYYPLKLLNFFKRIKRTKKIKQTYQIDLSISFLEGANYVNVLSRVTDKVIISQRGSISHDFDIKGAVGYIRKKILIPFIYNRVDKIVALSKGLRDELVNNFNIPDNKVSVIYNHYDLDEISSISSQEIDAENKNIFCASTLVTLGRLHVQKGHSGLIEVFHTILNTQKTPMRLVIFGDGPLRDDLINLARDLGLKVYSVWSRDKISENYNLYFMGYVKDPYKYIAKSGAFVFPSNYEGLSNAIVEALGCSIPIIASDCHSGPREIIAPGTKSNYHLVDAEYAEFGILMPKIMNDHDKHIWAKTIINIILDKELNQKYSAVGKQRMLVFNKETITRKWADLLDDNL